MKNAVNVIIFLILFGLATSTWAQENTLSQNMSGQPAGSIEERLEHLEKIIVEDSRADGWYHHIQVGGSVEVEGAYEKIDYDDSSVEDEQSSDLDLAKAELVVDVDFMDHVDGHVTYVVKTDTNYLDEGIITLTGTERLPAYLIAGRQYLPFGNYDSYFISDPNTLILGETNEGAAVAGLCANDESIDLSIGAFNGKVDESNSDDIIDSYTAAVTLKPVEALSLGASYISNLASSDALSDMVSEDDGIKEFVDGWSAFATIVFFDRISIMGEYVAALDRFGQGELYNTEDSNDNDINARKPEAWNVELGVTIVDGFELAVRYGGAEDGGSSFLPETQFGGVFNWAFLENTNLAVEYLHNEYPHDVMEIDTVTAQLAVEL